MSKEPAKSRRRILPGKVSLSFVIIPFLVRWGIGLGLGLWASYNMAMDADGHMTVGRLFASVVPLAVLMFVGWGVSTLWRALLVGFLMDSLRNRGEIGRALSSAAQRFHTIADKNNGGLIIPRAALAARKAGLAEADSIVAALNKVENVTPELWWRTTVWCEQFGDVMNRLLPYSSRGDNRPEHGWWANQILPGAYAGENLSNARNSVIAAISHADPSEGGMLCAFLIEAQALHGSGLSASEVTEFSELTKRAKTIADGIVSNTGILPVQGERGNLARMRKILSKDSAEL